MAPSGAEVATPEEDVAQDPIRKGETRTLYPWNKPKHNWVHAIGDGIGECENPCPQCSSQVTRVGQMFTQLASSEGVIVRCGIGKTCLRDIDETTRMAPLSKTYVLWARQFGDGSD